MEEVAVLSLSEKRRIGRMARRLLYRLRRLYPQQTAAMKLPETIRWKYYRDKLEPNMLVAWYRNATVEIEVHLGILPDETGGLDYASIRVVTPEDGTVLECDL